MSTERLPRQDKESHLIWQCCTFSYVIVLNVTNSSVKGFWSVRVVMSGCSQHTICASVCFLGTAGLQWHWTWADNLFTVCSGELINKCWVISARSNYPCRWQGECVSTPLHPRPCPEGSELVCKNTHSCTLARTNTHTHTRMHVHTEDNFLACVCCLSSSQ